MANSRWMVVLGAVLIVAPGLVYGQSVELRDTQRQVAALYRQGHYRDAVPLARQAIRLSEREFGAEHPTTATLIDNLAKLYQKQAMYAEAEPLYRRALAIREATLGANDPEVAASYNSLGKLNGAQGKFADADAYHGKALEVMQHLLAGNPHQISRLSREASIYRAETYHNRARLFHRQGRNDDAKRLFGAAVRMLEGTLGYNHTEVADALDHYATLLRDMGRPEEAADKEARAQRIRARRK